MKQLSSTDKFHFNYLKYLIINKTKEVEEQGKREIFDIDAALIIGKNFQRYKKTVYETSILVEKFWLNLRRSDFDIKEVTEIGKTIVDNYLVAKRLYEIVIEQNSEHRELIILSISFYQEVLNFEVEM